MIGALADVVCRSVGWRLVDECGAGAINGAIGQSEAGDANLTGGASHNRRRRRAAML